jgi:hypothetical protein
VARDRLNFFRPFERLAPNHENELTRALLVVLRLSPLAHVVWLRYVAPDRQLEQLPPAEFDTSSAPDPRIRTRSLTGVRSPYPTALTRSSARFIFGTSLGTS